MKEKLTIICKHLTIILFVFALAMPSQMNAQDEGFGGSPAPGGGFEETQHHQ